MISGESFPDICLILSQNSGKHIIQKNISDQGSHPAPLVEDDIRVTWGKSSHGEKSSFTEISVFESLSWHSCDMELKVLWFPLCLHSLVISV